MPERLKCYNDHPGHAYEAHNTVYYNTGILSMANAKQVRHSVNKHLLCYFIYSLGSA